MAKNVDRSNFEHDPEVDGSQWSSYRAAAMSDCRLRPRTSLAAEFWTRWKGESVDAERTTSTELQ